MNQKWKILIIVSIMLNILLIGAFLGRASFGLFESKPHPPFGMGPHNHERFMPLVFERHADEQQKIEQKIEALRQKVHLLLLQEPINKQDYDNLMVQLNEQFARKFKLMNRSIFEVASELNLEQRETLIQELNRTPMRMPPPQEAIQSCVNQEENSACQTKGPRGEAVQGQCKTTPDQKYFACMPERPDRPKR